MIETLLTPQIQSFIKEHQKDDLASLGLQKPPDLNWPYTLILDQIKARQKASTKIPAWLKYENLVFPNANIIEQASSLATARYKACLMPGDTVIDLTAGAGVDSAAFTTHFNQVISVERDEMQSKILAHNAPILSPKHWKIINICAEDFLTSASKADLIYIDPQRRNDMRKGLYKFADCSPNITSLLESLKTITNHAMVKASPMIDITKGIEELGSVREVHVVEWNGQCREVLFILDFEKHIEKDDIPLKAVRLNDQGKALDALTFTRAEEKEHHAVLSEPLEYLYEPYPAFLKAGCYNTLTKNYDVFKLHPQTHLYTSKNIVAGFPGRAFKIIGQYPAQSKKMPLEKANLAVRNFPLSAPALQKKLKIKDGGNDYLFACTLSQPQEQKTLIHGQKI